MKTLLTIIGLCLLVAQTPAAEFPPADHHGADLILSDGDVIWGKHTGVDRFIVETTSTVSIQAYVPAISSSGHLEVYADDIIISGTLTAEGAGYTGGGGERGEGTNGGPDGIDGLARYTGYSNFEGYGDGPFAGGKHPTEILRDGGYDNWGSNTDTSIDTSILMGSGGQAGPPVGGMEFDQQAPPCSYYALPRGGKGGDGGGPGGGSIILVAGKHIRLTGAIITRGKSGQRGEGGGQGQYFAIIGSLCIASGATGGDGGNGDGTDSGETYNSGYGAGGGVLLFCASQNQLLIEGSIDARGGESIRPQQDAGIHAGGSVKIFCMGDSPASNTIKAGRIYIRNLEGEPFSAIEWLLGINALNPIGYDSNHDLIIDAADL
ncbi:MAG: hypothetical protein ABI579_06220 [Candidatus Sumerlaeota bacterium]